MNIIDDTDGTTVYLLPAPVTVKPYNQLANSLAESISSNDASSPMVIELNSWNLNLVSKNVISLATVFNIQSSVSLNSNTSLNNSAVSANDTAAIAQINNQMASLREFLVNKMIGLSVSDISSIKVISSALSVATQTVQQVSATTAVIF